MHQETLIDISKEYVWNQLKKALTVYQSNQKKKKKKEIQILKTEKLYEYLMWTLGSV